MLRSPEEEDSCYTSKGQLDTLESLLNNGRMG